MIPWTLLDRSEVPGKGEELKLYQRGSEFSIRSGYRELMNSRMHGSEEALAELACARIAGRRTPRILIGGLGMGYTLAAALRSIRGAAEIVVAELVPAVVRWNRGPLSEVAGHPLKDRRVTVEEGDVGRLIRARESEWDAILLDVDNGPEGMTRQENDWLYGVAGLRAAFVALRPGGVLSIWSATPEAAFTKRLRKGGFEVEEVRVRARGSRGGARHMVWLATRPGR
jgi:spermidine synthase